MPSLGDSVFIFMLALMLFGPKKLPQLARQLGKLMAEFRRASNEFRMQMEDELRIEDQKEHQKKVDALAGPVSSTPDPTIPTEDPPHPHLPAPTVVRAEDVPGIVPIAESGELKMMPPSTGLPLESSVRRSSYGTANGNGAAHAGSNGNGEGTPEDASPAAIEEHSIRGAQVASSSLGMSSEEPGEANLQPAPDRSQPAMVGEGERATHA